jgi:hypothetical protein
MEKRFLSRKDILSIDDRPQEEVHVPEWGEDAYVIVKSLSGRERDRFEASIMNFDGRNAKPVYENMRAKLVAMTVVDEQGNLLFSEKDVDKIGQKSGRAIDRIFGVAQRLSGISDGDMEELSKNSQADQSGSSTSD